MQRNRSRIAQISQIGRLSTAEAATLFRNSKAYSKAKSTYDYGSSSHTATVGKSSNKRLFSRSQPYRESNIPPLTP